jgi:hypothetical protein
MLKPSKQLKPAVRCTGLLAELEAELVRVKAMRQDAERRGELEYARYDFGAECGLRFAIEAQRRYSANDSSSPTPP